MGQRPLRTAIPSVIVQHPREHECGLMRLIAVDLLVAKGMAARA
jgi:hypothetical protein